MHVKRSIALNDTFFCYWGLDELYRQFPQIEIAIFSREVCSQQVQDNTGEFLSSCSVDRLRIHNL